MARVYGMEVLRMAEAEVLPFDYESYGKEIGGYIYSAKKKAEAKFPGKAPDFSSAADAAKRMIAAGAAIAEKQRSATSEAAVLNRALIEAERALLIPEGLPNRPWYRHAIYAPGMYTGYAAVVIPGVNESIDRGDAALTQRQIAALAAAITRASQVLEKAR
jgi:N-acetylated-alpha-linked acidic dipeptidase